MALAVDSDETGKSQGKGSRLISGRCICSNPSLISSLSCCVKDRCSPADQQSES